MKQIFILSLAALVLSGCATLGDATPSSRASSAQDLTEPEMAKLVDPNPFANYAPAMKSSAEFPLTVNWQDAHKAEIAEATKPETLIGILRKDNGKGLLEELKAPYHTDPIVMQQIAALTQFVMDPATNAPQGLRARWAGSLLKKIQEPGPWWQESKVGVYHALFCLDQLRWCARPEDAKALREIAKFWNNGCAEDTQHVREFAEQVEREIAR